MVTSCFKNCLPSHVNEGKREEAIKQGAGHMQLLDDLYKKRRNWKLKRKYYIALSEKHPLEEILDLLQDRLRNEYACYTTVLLATSFLTLHDRVITQEPSCHSMLYVHAHTMSSRNLCLKKHTVKSAFLTAVPTMMRVLWDATLCSLQIHPHFVRTCSLLLSDKTS